MMKKFAVYAIVLLLAAQSVFAQTSDVNAVKILKSVSQKYSAFKTMQMDIALTVENMESKSKETKKIS